MAVRNLCREQLRDEEMATYGLWSEWDDFYLAALAAVPEPSSWRSIAAIPESALAPLQCVIERKR
jgi:hypothetical protein